MSNAYGLLYPVAMYLTRYIQILSNKFVLGSGLTANDDPSHIHDQQTASIIVITVIIIRPTREASGFQFPDQLHVTNH